MRIDFFTTDRMSVFWTYVKMLLQTVSPMVMVFAAVICVGFLLGIVVKAWKSSSKQVENQDEIEYREY